MLKEVTKTQEDSDVLEAIENSYQVVLYNDEVNTFDWVIECLVEICGHDALQAEQCAMLVHFKGKAIVKSGELTEMQDICTALCDRDLSAVVES
jgi:ATP-dependent Clp protease adaptor protein ClpS